MDRKQAIAKAEAAADRAAALAKEAERFAHSFDDHPKVARYAAAGTTWADTSRAYTELAQVLPDTAAADGDH